MAGKFPPAQTVDDAVTVADGYAMESVWQFVEHLGDAPGMATAIGEIFRKMGDLVSVQLPMEKDLANLCYAMQQCMKAAAVPLETLKPSARKALAEMYAKIQDSPHGDLYNKGG